jgi:sensor histidine kinase YesM
VEVIITSVIAGLLFGAILGHFTTLDIFPKLELSEEESDVVVNHVRPDMWLERHNNLNSALIQLRRKAEVKDDTSRARHRNLQLQMNPHFIFNALTGIHMLLLREDKPNSLRAIRKFKALLVKSWDSAIDSPKSLYASSLNEEISFLSDYVELEKMRLNTKVDFQITTSSNLFSNYPIPSFLIQPLVENALWHGINDTVESNVCVHFEALENNNTLDITVTDDGRGLPEKVGEKVKKGHKSFGLQILKERLLLISEESRFSIENRQGAKGCVSKLTIPLFHGIA